MFYRYVINTGIVLIYLNFIQGYSAGNAYDKQGSGSNFFCLPKNPEWKKYTNGHKIGVGNIFGVEYEIFQDKPFPKSFNNNDMPCSVCLSRRPTALMIPGKNITGD